MGRLHEWSPWVTPIRSFSSDVNRYVGTCKGTYWFPKKITFEVVIAKSIIPGKGLFSLYLVRVGDWRANSKGKMNLREFKWMSDVQGSPQATGLLLPSAFAFGRTASRRLYSASCGHAALDAGDGGKIVLVHQELLIQCDALPPSLPFFYRKPSEPCLSMCFSAFSLPRFTLGTWGRCLGNEERQFFPLLMP